MEAHLGRELRADPHRPGHVEQLVAARTQLEESLAAEESARG